MKDQTQHLMIICIAMSLTFGLIQIFRVEIISRRIDILQQEVLQLKAQQSQNK